MLKNWCFWTVVLEKTLDSPLDSKEIKRVNPKGNQLWIFIGRTDSEAEAPILWPPDGKSQPWCWERLRARGKGVTKDETVGWHHRLNGHEFQQTPGDSKGRGILVYCMGLQRVRHDYDWTTTPMGITNTWMWLALLRTTFQVLEDSQEPNDEFLLSYWWPLPPLIIPVALSPQPLFRPLCRAADFPWLLSLKIGVSFQSGLSTIFGERHVFFIFNLSQTCTFVKYGKNELEKWNEEKTQNKSPQFFIRFNRHEITLKIATQTLNTYSECLCLSCPNWQQVRDCLGAAVWILRWESRCGAGCLWPQREAGRPTGNAPPASPEPREPDLDSPPVPKLA